jgi:hypothetical protein
MMPDKIDPPDEDDAARDRAIYLEEMSRLQSKNTGLEDTIAALQADNWRLIQKAERDKPPEIWFSLKAASMVDGDRTERQRDTDYENMRKKCENGTLIAEKRGAGRGLWFVRMDNDWAPMLRK